MKQNIRLKVLLLWAFTIALAKFALAANPTPQFRNSNNVRNNQIQQRINNRYNTGHFSRTTFRESKLILVSTLDGSIVAMDKFENYIYWTLKGGQNGELLKTASYFHSDDNENRDGYDNDIYADTVGDDEIDDDQSDMWRDLPPDIAPLVDMGEGEDATPEHNHIVYIVEPKDNGTIYVYENGKRLTRLPLSIKAMVDSAPAKFQDDTVYVGGKSTKLIAVNPRNGHILNKFDMDNAADAFDIASQHHLPSDTLFIGRVDYRLAIFNTERKFRWNVSYSEYVPNAFDMDIDILKKEPSKLYVAPGPTGELTAIDLDQGTLLWTRSLPYPAVDVFDVYSRPDDTLAIVKQLVPQLPAVGQIGKLLSKRVTDNTAYVGSYNGHIFAMSNDNFPLVQLSEAYGNRGKHPLIEAGPSYDEDDEDEDDTNNNDSHQSHKGYPRPSSDGHVYDPTPETVCRIDSPNFLGCMRGLHGVKRLDSPTSPNRLLDAVDNKLSGSEPGNLIPGIGEPDRKAAYDPGMMKGDGFWQTGIMAFWKTFLLIILSFCYLRRKTLADYFSRFGRPIVEDHILPRVERHVLPHIERYIDSYRQRTVVDFDMDGNKNDKRAKAKPNRNRKKGKESPTPSIDSMASSTAIDVYPAKGDSLNRSVTFATDTKPDEHEGFTFVDMDDGASRNAESNAVGPTSPPLPPVSSALAVTETILGYGSHGTIVYKGTFDGRDVAVKRLLVDFYDIASQEVRLLQESDDHPNVIRYYFKEERERFLYIALELCYGSLYDFVEKTNSVTDIHLLDTVNPVTILFQIVSGLQHLHSLKIVHRDIKPQNILVAPGRTKPNQAHNSTNVRVMISDFGLCKKLDADQSSFHNTTASAAGTIGWRAPELLAGTAFSGSSSGHSNSSVHGNDKLSSSMSSTTDAMVGSVRVTRAIDIFSAGCLFYYVLSHGEHPFGDKFSREVNILKGSYNLDRLEDLGADAIEAKDLIERMISANPKDRPSAEQVMIHPYFWNNTQRLAFLQDASDRFEIEERHPPSPLLQTLEADAPQVIGHDWHKRIDRVIVNDLGKFRKYDGSRIRDLLRALRNKKHHYQDLSEPVRRAFGEPPDAYLHYFTSRFPYLLLHVYYVISEDEWLRGETMFKDYFELH